MSVLLAQKHAAPKRLVPHWLIHLGLLGVFAVAILDASPIPLPLPGSTDLLILVLAAHRGNPWLLAIAGIAGSLIGAYTTWEAAKKGGMAMVQRYVPERFLKRIEPWVKRNGMLSVMVACVLPPPIPLLPFLLCAGALGVERRPFLTAVAIARTARYGLVAWLGAVYGRRVIRLWSGYAAGWSDVILWSFIGLVIAAILFGLWKYKHDKRRLGSAEPVGAAG
ncbi:membrane protein YqaA with SNARE-associated domain [Silvibacterium bohemicum]|uniref:Membrane protein YqaA with SNARE-associated domain n=1 Tax=Silvibacterium bohemicum TaxID=1577686 RepID=A0A841JLE3_9BACT|nr:VTT domain-containing protein [Silvibacterium bohemicum]MBB6142166.1 membrane protein YqaA with SNARE-associated domain [Silvibacterium bohemicum]